MMKNYDQSVEINNNQSRSYIPEHPNRILFIGGLGLGKTNVLLKLIKIKDHILTKFIYMSKIHSKYHLLINNRKNIGIKKIKNPKMFIDYSQTIDDVYQNLEHYNLTNKMRVLIVFDDMIADMERNQKLSPIVTELFLRGRKLNILLYYYFTMFILRPYFKVSKTIRQNATH